MGDEQPKIRAGDLAKLKSGGPRMTINRRDGDLWECVWIVESVLHTGTFHRDALTIVAPKPKPDDE